MSNLFLRANALDRVQLSTFFRPKTNFEKITYFQKITYFWTLFTYAYTIYNYTLKSIYDDHCTPQNQLFWPNI